MPIYEYQCTKCGHQMEALHKISDEPLRKCPACRKSSLKKLVSAASFRLKGGGWYETDFKTGNKKQLAESESASPASSAEASKSDNSKAEPSASKADAKSAATKDAPNKPINPGKPTKETKKAS